MESNKINVSKIKAAGNNLTSIGFTMIAGIVTNLIQVVYTMNTDVRSGGDINSFKAINYFFIFIYILCLIIIVFNLISAGINLSTSNEEAANQNIESKILVSKLSLTSPRSGELAEGGIIVDANENDEHGLVCSVADLGKVNWNNAIKLCEDCREGGFSDWRMPNKDELQLIYTLLHKSKSIGDFTWKGKAGYWCSNDVNKNDAMEIHFEYGQEGIYKKSLSNNVRAVRSF